MGRKSQIGNDYFEEMLTIGPFGGLDVTTSPYFVAPTNFVEGSNFVPNQSYGGYVTVPGRIEALTALLPGVPYGIGCMQRAGEPDLYFFALDADGEGQIWVGTIGSAPTQLTLPETLSAGARIAYFVPSRKWLFFTNGLDRPIKIDTSLNATYWGIVAPASAPTGVTSGSGPLVGTYYYCETFSAADPSSGSEIQESSQGIVSAPIVASGLSASGTFAFSGPTTAGDILTAIIDNVPVSITVLDGWTLVQAIAALASAINNTVALQGTATARISGNDIVITSASTGASGNAIVYYAVTSTGATETISPTVPTNLTGGQDGNSITVTPVATTTDPQVTTRNLYRLGGSLGAWYLIHSQPVDDLTPFLDVTADSLVTGQSLVVFRDPPPIFTAIGGFQDRVFGFGIAPNDPNPDPTAVLWSNYNEPWGFNLDTNELEAGPNNFNDVAVTCGSIGAFFLLLKTRSAYAVIGNSDTTFTVIELFQNVGCISPSSLIIGDNWAVWDALRGIQYFDGTNRLDIADGMFQVSNIKTFLKSLSQYDRSRAVGFYYDRMACMSYPSVNATVIFDTRTSQWFMLDFALAAVYYDSESPNPVIGANLEVIGEIDNWFQSIDAGDLGAPIIASLTTRITDGGDISSNKSYRFFYVEAPAQSGAFVNACFILNPGGEVESPVWRKIPLDQSKTARQRWELPIGSVGQSAQMKIQTIGLNQVTLWRASLWAETVAKHQPSSATDLGGVGDDLWFAPVISPSPLDAPPLPTLPPVATDGDGGSGI